MPRRGENIYKRKDGRWEGRMAKPGGGYRYVYGKSYKEVREKKKHYLESPLAHAPKTNGAISGAADLFGHWLESDVLGRVKPSTYESYYWCIRKYVIPFFRDTATDRITEFYVEQFAKSIYANDVLTPAYKKKILSVFKVALGEILKDSDHLRPILKNIGLPHIDNPAVQVFSVQEQRRIETEVLKMNDKRALGVFLCFYTGIRLGELCALKWENIDFEAKTVSIVKTVSRTKNFAENGNKTILITGTPKSQNSTRKIPIPDFLLSLTCKLKNAAKAESNYILSGSDTSIDPRTYQRLFKRILVSAGVKDRKFHAIRHTFATRALEAGVDIKTLSEILGHSSVIITLKVYAHSLMEQKIAAINKLNNLYIIAHPG
ncbi:tyrosine-type recombinase/integrase [Sporomusa termitida]|uniref:Tyrosine recombinase XerC n=1 Tax=Sporomusa termitida TaxID=2377 RepID=A0A517DQN4_9FIRM|nr:tyrosine-type recombinase/integrase [Sporomusa termitida]QDR79628.1 Tyrosine recombinase XerC [Sporomusa termitida]